jgi:hypothetical protein
VIQIDLSPGKAFSDADRRTITSETCGSISLEHVLNRKILECFWLLCNNGQA